MLNGRARVFRFTAVFRDGGDPCMVFDRDASTIVRMAPPAWVATENARVRVRSRGQGGSLSRMSTSGSYAGTPLADEHGRVFGVLCHFDDGLRVLDATEFVDLREAAQVIAPALRSGVFDVRMDRSGPASERNPVGLRGRDPGRPWAAESEAPTSTRDVDERRSQLRRLVEQVPVAMAIWSGPDHRFDMVNEPYRKAFAGTRALRGKTLREAYPEVEPDHPLLLVFDDVYRTGNPFAHSEYRVVYHHEGRPHVRYFAFNLIPTRDEERRVDGLMACAVDVTEVVRQRARMEAERDRANVAVEEEKSARSLAEAARARSEFLLAVANALSEGLDAETVMHRLVETIVPARADYASAWLVDGEGAARRVASAPMAEGPRYPEDYARRAGRLPAHYPVQHVADTAETVVVRDLHEMLRPDDPPEMVRLIEEGDLCGTIVVPVRRGLVVEAVLAVTNRSNRQFTEFDTPMFEGVAVQAGLALDNARLFAEAESLCKTAEDATLAKDQFLARVSHDLRNPLGSILGWAGLLKAKRDPDKIARGLDVIERNAKAQVQLIEDLLDISRIASGKLKLELSVESVAAMIDHALDAARLAASAKNIALDVEVDPNAGEVLVDRERFQQVVWNLVSNAVKFTPSGGHVRVTALRTESQLTIAVEDDGVGIHPAFLPHIFEKFEQADHENRRAGGLGLGLAIVRHVVELHGGTISVHSDGEEQGSRFTACFPLRTPRRASLPPSDPTRSAVRPGALAGIKILVVDDEDDPREVAVAILQDAGAEVMSASSGPEAILRYGASTPDAVVSDIGMPDMDGYAFMRALRKAYPDRRVPAVALSAMTRPIDRMEALSAGFSTHVPKPIEASELVLVLSSVLQR